MMDSDRNSNPWAPNSVFKDCSQGICSIYCPQWCYIIYSPPPPSIILGDDTDDHNSGFEFSPLILAVIGILATTFILVTCYTLISRFFRNRARFNDPSSQHEVFDSENNELAQFSSSSGLAEAQIKSLNVCQYVKGSGLVEGSDCSVCLSEFQENESLRLLPKCNHAFHLPCIDTWLKSHSSCPLCRSNISSSIIFDSSPNQRDSVFMEAPAATINIDSLEYQQRSDVVVVQSLQEQEVVVHIGGEAKEKWPIEEGNDGGNTEQMDRDELNISQRISVADIPNQSDSDV